MDSIPQWHKEIAEIVCMFEKELPSCFMDLQVHLLMHLVDEVELVGVVFYHWMFFLERYMKKLKGFVRQRENLEGYMEKGYISYESLYHSSEYINHIDNTLGAVIWDDKRNKDKREGELLQMNEKMCLINRKWLIICQIST
jgi:hypothetical protein